MSARSSSAASRREAWTDALRAALRTRRWRAIWCAALAAGAILLVCTVFSSAYAAGLVALGALGAYALIVLVCLPAFILKYLAYLFSIAIVAAGIFACEYLEVDLYEIQETSGFAGSAPLLLLGQWALLTAFVTVEFLLEGVGDAPLPRAAVTLNARWGRRLVNGSAALVLAVYLASFLSIAAQPAFLLGVDRFEYNATIMAGTIAGRFYNLLPTLVFLPAVCISKGNRILGCAGVAVYLVFAIWVGEKFGTYFTVLCIVLLCNCQALRPLVLGNTVRFYGLLCLVLAVLVGYAAFYMTSIAGTTRSNYLFERVAEEGQLWWKTYQVADGTSHLNEFGTEVAAALAGDSSTAENVGADYGIYKIMYLCAPADVVDAKLASGARYTDAGFASSYYYLGAPGVVLYGLISGVFIAFLSNVVAHAADTGRLLLLLIAGRFYNVTRTSFLMFTFGDFFDTAACLCYALLILRALALCTARVPEVRARLAFALDDADAAPPPDANGEGGRP